MERDERYEVDSGGKIVVGTPCTLTPSERKTVIEKMFSLNGWKYTILDEISQSHFHIKVENTNLDTSMTFHLYHGNVRKEDPERNREEKKIQLGTENDPRQHMDDGIILGFYVSNKSVDLKDVVVVAWPIEEDKNYPANPSLRVNMRNDILPAKNTGYYVDKTTGKNLVVFRPEFIYHYLENYKKLHYEVSNHGVDIDDVDKPDVENNVIDESTRIPGGRNILLYGVPGSGKSWTIEHEYCKQGTKVERLVFHPDYTNADFIGQILPVVDPEDKMVTYEFTPGPFTNILKAAYENPRSEYVLIIEEINRGNAPAIFGDIFQLLDRLSVEKTIDGINYKKGTSEYGITNANVAKTVYDDETQKVRIPSNLSILGTMNTSDQNAFTLDTAFQRRWNMRLIENNFNNVRNTLANALILDTGVTWRKFCETVNTLIVGNSAKMASAEDKRLGVYFVHEDDLLFDSRVIPSDGELTTYNELNSLLKDELLGTLDASKATRLEELREAILHNRLFPEKVIKYLWDDAFKFNHEALFDTENMDSLEKVIRTFIYSKEFDRFKIFRQSVRDALNPNQGE